MLKNNWIDFTGLGLILIWLVVSIWMVVAENGNYFQRLGSFGVASAVFYFAAVRMNAANPAPPSYHEKNELVQKQLLDSNLGLMVAHRDIKLIASALVRESETRGQVPQEVFSVLSSSDGRQAAVMSSENWKIKHEERSAAILNDSLKAEQFVRTNAKSIEVFQAVVLVLATLQWGFGDLFFGSVTGVGG